MPWPMHDVLEKVGGTGLLGAAAAFLAAVALFCGTAKIRRKDLPTGFPRDPEAAQAKYQLAYKQLEEAVAKTERTDELIDALKGHTAAQLSLRTFLEATGKNQNKTGDRS